MLMHLKIPRWGTYGGKEFLERLFTVKEIWFEILAQYHLHWLSVVKLQRPDRTCLKVGFDKKIWSHKSHLSNGQPLLRKRGARLLCICCCILYFLYFLYFQGTNFPRQKEAQDWVSHWVSASLPHCHWWYSLAADQNINKCLIKICLNLQFQNQPLVISTATLSPEKEVNNQSTHLNIPHHLRLSKKVLFGA